MSYIALANITLSSSASSVTFSNIPTSVNGTALRDLVLVINGQMAGNTQIGIRLNGDTASNYAHVHMVGQSGTGSFSYTLDRFYPFDWTQTSGSRFDINLAIMDFMATDKHKACLNRANGRNNSQGVDATSAGAFRWASTSAVTSIVINGISANFSSGTTFSLFGIAG